MAGSRCRRSLTRILVTHGLATGMVTGGVILLGRGPDAFAIVTGAVLFPAGLHWYINLVIDQERNRE